MRVQMRSMLLRRPVLLPPLVCMPPMATSPHIRRSMAPRFSRSSSVTMRRNFVTRRARFRTLLPLSTAMATLSLRTRIHTRIRPRHWRRGHPHRRLRRPGSAARACAVSIAPDSAWMRSSRPRPPRGTGPHCRPQWTHPRAPLRLSLLPRHFPLRTAATCVKQSWRSTDSSFSQRASAHRGGSSSRITLLRFHRVPRCAGGNNIITTTTTTTRSRSPSLTGRMHRLPHGATAPPHPCRTSPRIGVGCSRPPPPHTPHSLPAV